MFALVLTIGFGFFLALSAAGEPGQASPAAPKEASLRVRGLEVHEFQIVKRDSGPVNYYEVQQGAEGAYIHAAYKPPLETVTLGIEAPDDLKKSAQRLRWRWRALTLPVHGDECQDEPKDSAAAIYVSFRRGFKWYALKYIWSTEAPIGVTCNKKRNLFMAQDSIVLRSGGPLNQWMSEEINLAAEFRKHFADGDPAAEVPRFMGVGLLTDGDQTLTQSAADYAGFELLY